MQFLQNLSQFIRNSAETAHFHKILTPVSFLKFWFFMEWKSGLQKRRISFLSFFRKTNTTLKESVFGVIPVRIFPSLDWIQRDEVSLCVQSEYRKTRTRITPNTDNFHAVCWLKAVDYFHWKGPSQMFDRVLNILL